MCSPASQAVVGPCPKEARHALKTRPTAWDKPEGCVAFWCVAGQHEITNKCMHKRKNVKPVFKAVNDVFKVFTKDNIWDGHSSGLNFASHRGVEVADDDIYCCNKC
jgi:hypothetical protein